MDLLRCWCFAWQPIWIVLACQVILLHAQGGIRERKRCEVPQALIQQKAFDEAQVDFNLQSSLLVLSPYACHKRRKKQLCLIMFLWVSFLSTAQTLNCCSSFVSGEGKTPECLLRPGRRFSSWHECSLQPDDRRCFWMLSDSCTQIFISLSLFATYLNHAEAFLIWKNCKGSLGVRLL